MKKLGVLGSTGSVGSQTLEVVKAYREDFELVGILAKRASEKLLLQAVELKPRFVSCYEEPSKDWLSELPEGTAFLRGEEGLHAIVENSEILMNAISGVDGILPTYLVLQQGKRLLASNKESLICLRELVRENKDRIVPVDSEHNALFQIMLGLRREDIRKVYLTASGGPFRDKSLEELKHVSVEDALKHPTWRMGAKITIDSATLMNKGMELIEAINLFDLEVESLEVVIHPQSIIHSMVQFEDGSLKAQMGLPDMKLPIQYAMGFPNRIKNNHPRLDFKKFESLTFEEPDTKTFMNLALAIEALNKAGNLPCVMNAANEIAVWAFLRNRIGFLDMMAVVEQTMKKVTFIEKPTLDDYFESDGEARNFAASLIKL